MDKIIVDIDNTLWDFGSVLYERMSSINPAVTAPQEWHVFDFFKAYISTKTFYKIITSIHMNQDQFLPFPDAQSFLASLKEMGFHIIIASHREKGTLGPTVRWLQQNNLVFDELHLSNDKTVLFDDCVAVVDDSPFILSKAADAGIIGTGLKMPWNEHDGYSLFGSLTEILQYIEERRG